jgi:hypothetical protein
MVISHHPIRTTIFFGLICGLSFIPAHLALNYVLHGPSAACLTLWLYAAGYSLLLSRWRQKLILSSGYPLLLLFITSFLVNSIAAFYLLSLGVISWIRSGIYFRNPCRVKLVVELLLCVLGGIPVAVFTPDSAFTWVLGIWMFFLIQSLYFVIFENRAMMPEDQYETDPFERAGRKAEVILSNLCA